MNKRNISNLTKILKENYDVEIKNNDNGASITIDITDLSHSEIKQLIKIVKQKLNKHQTKITKEEVIKKQSNELVNEIMNCFKKINGDVEYDIENSDENLDNYLKPRDSSDEINYENMSKSEKKKYKKDKKKSDKKLRKQNKKEEKVLKKQEKKYRKYGRKSENENPYDRSNGKRNNDNPSENVCNQIMNKLERLEAEIKQNKYEKSNKPRSRSNNRHNRDEANGYDDNMDDIQNKKPNYHQNNDENEKVKMIDHKSRSKRNEKKIVTKEKKQQQNKSPKRKKEITKRKKSKEKSKIIKTKVNYVNVSQINLGNLSEYLKSEEENHNELYEPFYKEVKRRYKNLHMGDQIRTSSSNQYTSQNFRHCERISYRPENSFEPFNSNESSVENEHQKEIILDSLLCSSGKLICNSSQTLETFNPEIHFI